MPIINKPNFQNGQNERKLNFSKGLQKKRLFSTPKNKPNSNPILVDSCWSLPRTEFTPHFDAGMRGCGDAALLTIIPVCRKASYCMTNLFLAK